MLSGSTTRYGLIISSVTTIPGPSARPWWSWLPHWNAGWDTKTFQALDALEDALRDVEQSDFPYWENIL